MTKILKFVIIKPMKGGVVMKTIGEKTMFLLEKDVDFTESDMEENSAHTKRYFLTKKFKETFAKQHGFKNASQQFELYFGSDNKIYAQIEFEK